MQNNCPLAIYVRENGYTEADPRIPKAYRRGWQFFPTKKYSCSRESFIFIHICRSKNLSEANSTSDEVLLTPIAPNSIWETLYYPGLVRFGFLSASSAQMNSPYCLSHPTLSIKLLVQRSLYILQYANLNLSREGGDKLCQFLLQSALYGNYCLYMSETLSS